MKAHLIRLTCIAFVIFAIVSCNKEGCTEPLADNYDKKAEIDNGSCSYANGPYSYAENDQVKITINVANNSGPVSESDIEIVAGNVVIAQFLEVLGQETYTFDPQLFLDAGVQNGTVVNASASAFGQSGSNSLEMPENGELDFGFVMIE